MQFTTRPLDVSTWDAFAELMERNNGVFGGCWCLSRHPEGRRQDLDRRAAKADRVRRGDAHAALVFDADGLAQGWCQYGAPAELPGIPNRVKYEQSQPPVPDWRITCFYVDKKHRRQGVARAALAGALDLIAASGGGLVEAISEATTGRDAAGRFLYVGSVELFEEHGFTRGSQVGKNAFIVSKAVGSAV